MMLLFWQVVLAYGFCDAGTLLFTLVRLDAFQEEVHLSVYYPDSVSLPDSATNGAVPSINLLCSFASIGMLCFYMRDDNLETMMAGHPIDHLIWSSRGDWKNKSGLWRLAAAVPLQFCYSMRAILLPVLAGTGSAYAFAASSNAQDIVLNSVAIAFVFELDEMAYDWLLGPQQRSAFETAMSDELLLQSVHRRSGIAQAYSWLVVCVDALCMVTVYLYAALGIDVLNVGVHVSGLRIITRNCLYIRGSAMSLCALHLSVHKHPNVFSRAAAKASPIQFAKDLLRLLVQALFAFGQLLMVWAVLHFILTGTLGHRPQINEASVAAEATSVSMISCLQEAAEVSCKSVHKDADNIEKLRAVACDECGNIENMGCPGPFEAFSNVNYRASGDNISEPDCETTATVEPPVDEPPADQPPVDEDSAEELPADQPPVEEPPVE